LLAELAVAAADRAKVTSGKHGVAPVGRVNLHLANVELPLLSEFIYLRQIWSFTCWQS